MFLNVSKLSDIHQQICSYGEAFTNLIKIFELPMVIFVYSANAERSFSTMRRIKIYTRAAMQSPRLSNLVLLFIDKVNSEKLLKDPTSDLELFRKMNNRKLRFQI